MSDQDIADAPGESRKRSRVSRDSKYPRRRSLKACQVCRARKTKCDNVLPVCGFCSSLGISCAYDDAGKDHSVFDPASLEILSQLSRVSSSQDEVLRILRSVAASQQAPSSTSNLLPGEDGAGIDHLVGWNAADSAQEPREATSLGWPMQQNSARTSPAASMSVAAAQWFGLVSEDASREAFAEGELARVQGSFLQSFDGHVQEETPLQRATKVIDSQSLSGEATTSLAGEEALWQATESIALLPQEQIMFENFLHRICSWLDLYDTARRISTILPRLATRNAGLLNAVLALSCYHRSVDETVPLEERTNQNTALQYYYHALHYVQKAMRFPTYQHSLELLATTIIISTYEMFRGSRKDWQRHLRGVFWILRSRKIEVEASSLESSTWWAWLRQDIWAAFRERRRVYSTWIPKRTYAELDSHEIASRSLWILAQVVNFCAIEPSGDETQETTLDVRMGWAKALKEMLNEWESNLTVEFSELPASQAYKVFKPRLIHPPSFGLAVQIHHASRLLLMAHEPSMGGMESFIARQRAMHDSVETICGIAAATVDDATSMISSQCLFMAGLFVQDPEKRACVSEMLNSRRKRCGWPTISLAVDLEQAWADPHQSRNVAQ